MSSWMMSRVSRTSRGVTAAVCLAAVLGVTACSNDEPTMPSTPSLYDKYGGAATVRKLVDDAVTAVLADPVQAPFFANVGKAGFASADRIKSCLRLQFTAVLGGPATYPGRNDMGDNCRDMASTHATLGITGPVFDGFITDLVAVMKADGVSDADIATVAPSLTGLKTSIVTR